MSYRSFTRIIMTMVMVIKDYGDDEEEEDNHDDDDGDGAGKSF